MESSFVHFRRRVSAFIRGPAVGLLLVQLLACASARAVPADTVIALKYWKSQEQGLDAPAAEGVAVRRGNDVDVLWASNVRAYVEQSTLDGVFRNSWGKSLLETPTGIAVDPLRGDVYVCDPGSLKRILKFDPQGGFVSTWGRPGKGNGEFQNPNCLAVGENRCVYVADAIACDVQKFNSDGVFQARWKLERAPGLNLSPKAITVGPGGEVYVLGSKAPEASSKTVLVFDAYGRYLRGWNSYTSDHGDAYSPSAIAVNGIGMVVIADSATRSPLQVFNSTGVYQRAVTVMANGNTFLFRSLCFYYDDYLYGCSTGSVCKFRLF